MNADPGSIFHPPHTQNIKPAADTVMQDDYPAGQSSERGGGQKNKKRYDSLIPCQPGCCTPGPKGLWKAGQATAMADTLWAAGPESQIRGPVSRSLVRPCQRMHKVQEKYKNPRRTGKKLSANRNFTEDTQHI